MALNSTLEVRRSSAAVWGSTSGLRSLPAVSKLIDTSTCIGCKACEVACQEWNDLPSVASVNDGDYQTLPTLDASFWNLIRFDEREVDGGIKWLMRKDQCMHCADPGCLEACPAPGAIVQYENGIVDVNPAQCIGCGYCSSGCPFDVPRFSAKTGKMSKCTLCVDRVSVGLEPACIKACPTSCLQFGTKENLLLKAQKRVDQLKASGFATAGIYDPGGVGGTGVVTVLAYGDKPEAYGLPADPSVPWTVTLWKEPLKWIGNLAIIGGIIGTFLHYLRYGPKHAPEDTRTKQAPATGGPR